MTPWWYSNETCGIQLAVFYVGRIQEWQRTYIPCRCAGRFGKKKSSKKCQPINLISSPWASEWWNFLQASGSRIEVLPPKIGGKNQGIEVTKNRFVPFAELESQKRVNNSNNLIWRTRKMLSTCKVAVTSMFFEVFDKTGDVSWFFTFLGEQTMPICENLKGCLWSGLTWFVGLGLRKDPWHHGGFQHSFPSL